LLTGLNALVKLFNAVVVVPSSQISTLGNCCST